MKAFVMKEIGAVVFAGKPVPEPSGHEAVGSFIRLVPKSPYPAGRPGPVRGDHPGLWVIRLH